MDATINQVQEIVSVLTSDEQQLLKDTINYGSWGDSDWEFLMITEMWKLLQCMATAPMMQRELDISVEEKYLQCSALCIRNYAQQTTIR